VALSALFAAVAIFWLPSRVESLLMDELARRGKQATEALEKSALGALVVYDQGALNQLSKSFIRSNEILYVLILDKDGQNLADSGIEKTNFSSIERVLPEFIKTEADSMIEDRWPSTREPFFHFNRPVFYEQLRIGSVILGVSARRVYLTVSQLRAQLTLLCGTLLVVGTVLAFWAARIISKPLQNITAGVANQSNEQLEAYAGRVKEFNQLVETILKTRNLFKSALNELERQRVQFETELTQLQGEKNELSTRLAAVIQQVGTLQDKIRDMEAHSKDLPRLLPLVHFATGVAPEIDSSMQHIGQSAEQLRVDLERLKNLIGLYEKAPPLFPEDSEVIRRYKDFIDYDKIRQSMDDLVDTIRGGASWAEQLADLLKQLSTGDLTRAR
jgi:methyl-accepting chemotaxis protein